MQLQTQGYQRDPKQFIYLNHCLTSNFNFQLSSTLKHVTLFLNITNLDWKIEVLPCQKNMRFNYQLLEVEILPTVGNEIKAKSTFCRIYWKLSLDQSQILRKSNVLEKIFRKRHRLIYRFWIKVIFFTSYKSRELWKKYFR